MRFWEFYRIVSRRRWTVVGLVAVTLVAVFAATSRDKPYYQACVQIMPSDAALYRPILPARTLSSGGLTERQSGSELPNLMSLLKSRQVAERTIQMAGLREDPDALRERIHVTTAENPGARSRQEVGTDIIEVRVRDYAPERAINTANCLAHVFSNYYQEISHQEAADNRLSLESELAAARRNLDNAAARLKKFKRTYRITSFADEASSAMASLRQATAERDAARAALAETQAKLAEIDKQLRSKLSPTRRIEEGTSNTPMVQELEAQYADLTRQLTEARAKYEEAHPTVVALKDSLEQVRGKLEHERGKFKTSIALVRNPIYDALLQERAKLAYERDGLAAKAGQLDAAVARARGAIAPGTDVTLARLENEFKAAQTNYDAVEAQLNQARINEKETSATGAIRLVDPAVHAEGPIGANRCAFLVLGAILSLVLGVGFAIIQESLDNRIKTNADVERLLALPTTALIPRQITAGDSSLARVTYTDPLSPLSEAYRFLRTDLLLSTAPTNAKTIMMATAKPGQGGTTTVANLAISLAMDDKRVILVDADMRRPSLHRIFKAQNDFGLSNVLSNERDFEEVMVSTEVDNLLLLPAGPTPSNPSELLGSARMRALVAALAEYADYVLFDTPSAIAFTDSVVLSQIVDGVLLVIRAQQVPRGAELQVRDLLNKANANVLGVVLNDVQPEMVDSYYYHSHYYPDVGSAGRKALQGLAKTLSALPKEEQG